MPSPLASGEGLSVTEFTQKVYSGARGLPGGLFVVGGSGGPAEHKKERGPANER